MPIITINIVEVQNTLEDLGTDSIYFHIEATVDGQDHYTILTLDQIKKFCRQHLPNIETYIKSVRDSINGFGPKETKMWSIMQEEDFDIIPILEQYFDQHPDHLMPHPANRTVKESVALDQMVDDLDEAAANIKESNLRDIAFKDHLMEILSPKVLEYYPEIFESNPEFIKKVEEILIHRIIDIADDLDSLAYETEQYEDDGIEDD